MSNAAPELKTPAPASADGRVQKRLQIIAVEEKPSKAGNLYKICECILIGERIQVGGLRVYNRKGLEAVYAAAEEGEYFAEFDIGINYDREVVAEIVNLTPVDPKLSMGVKVSK